MNNDANTLLSSYVGKIIHARGEYYNFGLYIWLLQYSRSMDR